MDLVEQQDVETKLKLYAYGHQGTSGDITTADPGEADVKEQAKWEAWSGLKGTSQEDAKTEFIKVAKKVLGY